jgi:hypothetical protein
MQRHAGHVPYVIGISAETIFTSALTVTTSIAATVLTSIVLTVTGVIPTQPSN